MNAWTLIARSLRHFRGTHLGVLAGAAVATAVLVGALAVGDAVRLSLRRMAHDRIGRIDAAMIAGDRWFDADLADRVGRQLGGGDRGAAAAVAAVLQLRGVASVPGGDGRAGIVDVLGVDARFMALAPDATAPVPAADGALLGVALARHLGVGTGDAVLVRVEKPSALPRDMVMATVADASFAVRLRIAGVLDDDTFGRFSLQASQLPPFNVFVALPYLQRELALAGKANALFVGTGVDDVVDRANAALRATWTLADIGLTLRTDAAAGWCEVRTERIFVDDAVADALAGIEPRQLGVLTYFVNTMRHGDETVPYSMVTAVGPLVADRPPQDPVLAATLALAPAAADGIVLNDWTASRLGAAPGDAVALAFFELSAQLRLGEGADNLAVDRVVPLAGAAADPTLMPAFPGLEGAESCRDWEPGVPVDLERLEPADQEYWDDHRGTPKAFVALATGQRLWGNRFGALTAVRAPAALAPRIETELPRALDPARLGLYFRDVRGPALAAGTTATDFGGLFLGLSCFLIVSALLLTALLFAFGIEQRRGEIGLLLATGLRRAQVRRLFLGEAVALAVAGSVVGTAAGMGYTAAVLWALGTLWQDAVGATTLGFEVKATTLVVGAVASVIAATAAIRLALRRAFDRPAVELLRSRGGAADVPTPAGGASRSRRNMLYACLAVAAAVVVVAAVGTGSRQAAGAFFGAGSLLLLAAIFGCRSGLLRMGSGGAATALTSRGALAMRNTARRRGRSLACIALLASGTFLVVAVQAYRLQPPRDSHEHASGTGGFALFGRTTIPVARDLGAAAGREAYGLDEAALAGVEIVPLRVRAGDDASCLNLSLPQNPRLLGVRAAALAERGSFRFAAALPPPGGAAADSAWSLLDADWGADVVPAIGDQASVQWAMHKSLGDGLQYRDERGRAFEVRIVATLRSSILQGNLVIADRDFRARFPQASGHGMFLVDAPAGRVDAVREELSAGLRDLGLEITSTAARLAAFNAVQNTYLTIFQALGGLGLLLGSVGLGMVVLRNALERRAELALLAAVGFRAQAVRGLVWSEHAVLLGAGLVGGVAAALVAILPGLSSTGEGLPLAPVALLVAGVALNGAAWVVLATLLATRGPLWTALRDE